MSSIIHSFDSLKVQLNSMRNLGKQIVWTNGCFDIIHAGHIRYLQEASELGDILVVGLNSDESVKKLKGPDRPVFQEKERAQVLSAIRYVDYITIFNDTSPVGIIELFKPDIYVKGGDYTLETINQDERKAIESYGGSIQFVSLLPNFSTTATITKIKK